MSLLASQSGFGTRLCFVYAPTLWLRRNVKGRNEEQFLYAINNPYDFRCPSKPIHMPVVAWCCVNEDRGRFLYYNGCRYVFRTIYCIICGEVVVSFEGKMAVCRARSSGGACDEVTGAGRVKRGEKRRQIT